MKLKPKNLKASIFIASIVLAFAAIFFVLGFGTFSSGTRMGYVGKDGLHEWSGRYASMDGTMRHTLRPQGDTLTIDVETKSGTISIQINDTEGNTIFDEKEIGTETFHVEVSGKVSIRIEAEHHRGSFKIS